MLAESGLLQQLTQHSDSPTGQPLCIYGDPAYPFSVHLREPFNGAKMTDDEKYHNKSMSKIRVSMEWVFGDIINYFAFMDFRKIGLSSVGKMYITCVLLPNEAACLYHNVTTDLIGIGPSSIDNYFQ